VEKEILEMSSSRAASSAVVMKSLQYAKPAGTTGS
jgi:hypothetical protein